MSRTTINFRCNNVQNANAVAERVLVSNGYKKISENNETVWKNGNGWLTAMKYVKIEFLDNDTMSISGWIRPMLGTEQDLNGIVAALPKKQVMNVIKKIQSVI